MIGRLVQLVGYETARRDRRPSGKQPTTIGELYEALTTQFETLTSKIEKPQTQPRSWASIVLGTTGLSAGGASWVLRKVVPARHTREVVIKTKGCAPPPISGRSGIEGQLSAVLRRHIGGQAAAERRYSSGL